MNTLAITPDASRSVSLSHLNHSFVQSIASELVWNESMQAYQCNETTCRAVFKEINRSIKNIIALNAPYAGIDVIVKALNAANKIDPLAMDLKLHLLTTALNNYYDAEVVASVT